MRKLLAILMLAAVMCACGPKAPGAPAPETPAPTAAPAKPEKPRPTAAPAEPEVPPADGSVYPEAQLLGAAETEEEAEALAELYGITLVKYRNGLARFHTDEDPRAVIRRGQENGWPELTLNRISKTS